MAKKKKTIKRRTAKKTTKKKIIKKKSVKKTIRKKVIKRTPPAKKALKKTAKRKLPLKKKRIVAGPGETIVGTITHYFPKVRAAVIKTLCPLSVGDTIRIKGHTTDFTQGVTSLQIDRKPIDTAQKGQEIGLLVTSRVRRKDTVLLKK